MTTIQILPESDEALASHKERFEAAVRQRAFEIYCHHGQHACPAVVDWQTAQHELELLPVVGMDETDRDVRVSACVANERCGPNSVIRLQVMPHHIVAESGNRFSVLNLPCPVRTDKVRARLAGDQLSVVAARLQPREITDKCRQGDRDS